jgi:hypothetical protein
VAAAAVDDGEPRACGCVLYPKQQKKDVQQSLFFMVQRRSRCGHFPTQLRCSTCARQQMSLACAVPMRFDDFPGVKITVNRWRG